MIPCKFHVGHVDVGSIKPLAGQVGYYSPTWSNLAIGQQPGLQDYITVPIKSWDCCRHVNHLRLCGMFVQVFAPSCDAEVSWSKCSTISADEKEGGGLRNGPERIAIGSMVLLYMISDNIYHPYIPNVSIYTSTMDPMGYGFILFHFKIAMISIIFGAYWQTQGVIGDAENHCVEPRCSQGYFLTCWESQTCWW